MLHYAKGHYFNELIKDFVPNANTVIINKNLLISTYILYIL